MASAVVGSLRVILGLDTAEFEAGTREAQKALTGWSKDFSKIGQQATQLGGTLTKALTLPIVGLGVGVAKLGMDFETAFADVRKTVGGTEEEMAQLALTLRNMAKSMPLTTTELSKIAAMGGQMGVSAKNMKEFVFHVAALGTAVDGIGVEEAASSLAQIGNVAGTGTTKIAEMASALVHLGNNSVSTEGEILEFTKRLMGAGTAVGLTVPEVMALGTAMADVGINAEAGGTAMSTVLAKMSKAVSTGGDDLKEFARIAGESAESFAATFKSNPIQAVDLFVKGLAEIKKNGGDLNITMGEVGTEGIRVASTLKLLAGAQDGVSKSLENANEGYREANKHIVEFDAKNKTTAAAMKILWNQIRDVGLVLWESLKPAVESIIGIVGKLLPLVDSMAKGFTALPGPVQLVGIGLLAVVAAAGPLLIAFGQLAFATSSLTAAFATNGLAARTLGTHTATLTTALGFLAKSIAVVGTAFAGWALGSIIKDLGAMGEASETASQRVNRLGLNALTLGERVEAVSTQMLGFFRGEFLHKDDILTAIVSRRMALENAGKAAEAAGAAEETAATRSMNAQKALSAQVADLALQMANLQKSGAPASDMLESLGAQASQAKKQARLLGVDLSTLPPTVLALADSWDRAQFKAKGFTQSLEDQKKAQEKAKKAAEEAAKALEQQEQALASMGIVTEKEVNEKIVELTKLQELATKAGVPLVSSLKAQETVLKALAAKAKESGVEFKHLTLLIAELDRQIRALSPTPQALAVKMGLPAVITGLQEVQLSTLGAIRTGSLLEDAYKALGITSQKSLNEQAAAARLAYADILASGIATADQLKEARQKVLDAEVAAGQRTIGLWEGEIKPAIEGVIGGLSDSLARGLTDMIGHWNRAGDIMKEIWQGVKNSFLNVLQDMLSSFINNFLKGLLNSLGAANLGQALGGALLGGLGGMFGGASSLGGGLASAGAIGGTGGGIGGLAGGIGAGAVGTALGYIVPPMLIAALIAQDPYGESSPGYEAEMALKNFLEGAAYLGITPEEHAANLGIDIPTGRLAEGGIAVRPTFRMFGEAGPEAVLPLSRLPELMASMQAPSVSDYAPQGADLSHSAGWADGNMTIQMVTPDGRNVAEWLVPFVPGAVRRLGLAGTF